jgi:hypothetical protein
MTEGRDTPLVAISALLFNQGPRATVPKTINNMAITPFMKTQGATAYPLDFLILGFDKVLQKGVHNEL